MHESQSNSTNLPDFFEYISLKLYCLPYFRDITRSETTVLTQRKLENVGNYKVPRHRRREQNRLNTFSYLPINLHQLTRVCRLNGLITNENSENVERRSNRIFYGRHASKHYTHRHPFFIAADTEVHRRPHRLRAVVPIARHVQFAERVRLLADVAFGRLKHAQMAGAP